jgi:hypothetical protein
VNDNDTTARPRHPGRTINIKVYGDTADELELAALGKAREFFGADRQLTVIPDYLASRVTPMDAEQADGKQYIAEVRVRTVETA